MTVAIRFVSAIAISAVFAGFLVNRTVAINFEQLPMAATLFAGAVIVPLSVLMGCLWYGITGPVKDKS
jgi:hypothetical protein